MKTFYTSLLALIISVSSLAQNKVNIVIFSDDAEPFYVVVNGVRQNIKPETNVRISDLNMESFSFVVIFNDPNIKSITREQYLPFGYEYTFRIKKDKKGRRALKPFGQTALNEAPVNNGATNVVYHTQEYPANNTNNYNTQTNTTNNNTQQTISTNNSLGDNSNTYNTNVNTENTNTTTGINTHVQVEGTNIQTGVNTNTSGNSGSENVGINVNMNGMGINMNVNVSGTETNSNNGVNTNVNITGFDDSGTNTTTTTITTTTNVNGTVTSTVSSNNNNNLNTDYSGINNNSYNNNATINNNTNNSTTASTNGCYTAINDGEFQEMKKSISSKSFSESKMRTAKQATQNHCLSTLQIKEIMKVFDFEGDKLEYAKFAYDFTVDKNNYYKVNDAFDYESSISELDEYIKSKK
jgi:hypothetical protein